MEPGALRPATGNARRFLRKSCFRLPASGAEGKRTAKRTVSYPGPGGGGGGKGGDFLRLPDTAPGPTKIIVPDMAVGGEEDGYGGGAARARGKSPVVQKNASSKTTTV